MCACVRACVRARKQTSVVVVVVIANQDIKCCWFPKAPKDKHPTALQMASCVTTNSASSGQSDTTVPGHSGQISVFCSTQNKKGADHFHTVVGKCDAAKKRVFAKVNTVLGGGIYHICVGASVVQVHADTYTNTYTRTYACASVHANTHVHINTHTPRVA